jgi:putative FmdB family regulatory protein
VPLYEYECDACGHRFEVIEKFSDPPADVCAECGKGPVRRLLSSPAIQFKGSGFYITDYAQKGKSDPSSTAKTSDTTKADSKSDSGTSKGDTTKTDTTSTASKTKDS